MRLLNKGYPKNGNRQQNEKLKEEVKLLKQENQRLQKIVEQIKTWVPPGFHMQLGIADKKEN